ncbi:hypothetical protein SUGI_1191760 [Cryptomeria japonica]|nr:hypothetical protein SUGI_1191760 [Cryptomeria japonica]
MFTILEGVYGTNHTVGWKISDNQSLCRASGHGSNFLVGDILVFRMEDENDAIAQVMSKSEYEACRAGTLCRGFLSVVNQGRKW